MNLFRKINRLNLVLIVILCLALYASFFLKSDPKDYLDTDLEKNYRDALWQRNYEYQTLKSFSSNHISIPKDLPACSEVIRNKDFSPEINFYLKGQNKYFYTLQMPDAEKHEFLFALYSPPSPIKGPDLSMHKRSTPLSFSEKDDNLTLSINTSNVSHFSVNTYSSYLFFSSQNDVCYIEVSLLLGRI